MPEPTPTHQCTNLQSRLETARSRPPTPDITLEPGTRDDYLQLAHLHYRAATPATIVHILRARDHRSDNLAGVLVISMPVLCATWRLAVWPDLALPETRTDRAHALNQSVRTISRVIIDPRYRALGIAAQLVRTYLDNPCTQRTEAVAALGASCPFFIRAGMTSVPLKHDARTTTLLKHLKRAGIKTHQLADLDRTLERLTPALDRAMRTWARASGATRSLAAADPATLISRITRSVATSRIAFHHQVAKPA